MKPFVRLGMVAALLVATGLVGSANAAALKPVQTQKTKDVVITILSDSGKITQGKNSFVLEFTSAATKQPVDVGTVSFNTSMAMPGMAPMVAGATVTRDGTPGRYVGTITFPDSGARQVNLTWDGPAGKGSTRFSLPVR
jgi:hypothetical protein